MRTMKTAVVCAIALAVLAVVAAPASAQGVLFVKNDKVGIGDDDPTQALLTIKADDGTGAGFKVLTTNALANFNWYFQQNATTGAFLISNQFGGAAQFQVFPGQNPSTFVVRNNRVGVGTNNPQGTLDVRGSIVNNTTVHHADYVFEPDYSLESIEDHAASMWQNKSLPAIGKGEYTEDGLAVINLTERSQKVIEELEKAHIYIEQLNAKLGELGNLVARQQAMLDELANSRADG
jgi:hypothetical protein